jgi:serine/threonine-protein kinase
LDFGIAKLKAEQIGKPKNTRQRSLIGTPAYMSPEQCSWDSNIDARCDVWALSVMLYELCTGVLPFHGANTHAILLAIGSEEPKPLTELAAGNDELWRIVARGLEKDREFRWASARELGLALADWATRNGLDTDIAGNSIEAHWFSGGQRRPLSFFPPPKSTPPSEPRVPLRTRRDSDSQPHSLESGMREKPVRSKRPWLIASAGLLALFAAGFALGTNRIPGIQPFSWVERSEPTPVVRTTETPRPPPAASVTAPPTVTTEPIASANEPVPSAAPPVGATTTTTMTATPPPPVIVQKKKTALPRHRTDW